MTGDAADISAPEHLSPEDDLSAFDSGVPDLDEWLRRRAAGNEATGASRTYVVRAVGRVVGSYALAAGGVVQGTATGRVRRNMPDPVPVMVLGRLAVDRNYQGRGIAKGLLRDAILRTLQVARMAGIRALLVHAISPEAKRFYEQCGFSASSVHSMTLMITVADAERALGE